MRWACLYEILSISYALVQFNGLIISSMTVHVLHRYFPRLTPKWIISGAILLAFLHLRYKRRSEDLTLFWNQWVWISSHSCKTCLRPWFAHSLIQRHSYNKCKTLKIFSNLHNLTIKIRLTSDPMMKFFFLG